MDLVVLALLENTALPDDLCADVAEHLGQPDLLQIARVSQRVNAQANIVLYRQVTFDWGTPQRKPGNTKISPLMRTLLAKPAHATLIKSFSLLGTSLLVSIQGAIFSGLSQSSSSRPSNHELGPLTPEEYSRVMAIIDSLAIPTDSEYSPQEVVMAALLQQVLPHLEHLHIDFDFFVSGINHHIISRCSVQAQHLRSATLAVDAPSKPRATAEAQLGALTLPLLEPLKLAMLSKLELCLSADQTPSTLAMSACPSITDLTLHNMRPDSGHLIEMMLSHMPNLRTLRYHKHIREHPAGAFTQTKMPVMPPDVDWHHQLFRHVRQTLELMVVTENVLGAGIVPMVGNSYEPFHTRLSHLIAYPRLRILQVPFVFLVGWRRGINHAPLWEELLPPSLRDITITNEQTGLRHNRWQAREMLPVLKDLLDWFASKANLSDPLTFTLSLHRSGNCAWSDRAANTLYDLCDERGILARILLEAPELYRPYGEEQERDEEVDLAHGEFVGNPDHADETVYGFSTGRYGGSAHSQ